MSERRITQVVSQTRSSHDIAKMKKEIHPRLRTIFLDQCGAYTVGKRLAHASHLKGMREAVVHEYAAGKWEDLCLVLQPTKR